MFMISGIGYENSVRHLIERREESRRVSRYLGRGLRFEEGSEEGLSVE